ncbi:dethiobiotin synthase [Thiomicrospira microaerophila]|uniref:dethiobiotin synthase n=1 Tax=Thiomicrospira microaerophila TaxID=406020 RepID=UPI0020101F39|nr:dethiobiotin synthase [Thiomicrospira microaerophila]UQB42035.1 dethiobiotin synthase [Thiomicrospira microaerophila]
MIKPTKLTTDPGGFFITGTDTEIGKTYISCALARGFRQQGLSVIPRKPIASGCIWQQGQLVSEDALALKAAAASQEALSKICPYQFEAAISPARAIKQAGKNILINDLVQACQTESAGLVLVEGAGGFYSPIALDGLNADLAEQLALPIILVVGNRLGCINHALLTIEAVKARQLKLHSIIINDLSPEADQDNAKDLQALCDYPVISSPYSTQTELNLSLPLCSVLATK